MSKLPVNIFEYDNYRRFLKDAYQGLKKLDRKVSFRSLAMAAGFRSPNFLKLIMDGQRNLSAEGIGKVADAFRMSPEEALFFRNLVLMNQASSGEERNLFAEQLFRSKNFRKANPLKQSQFKYYHHWYYIPVRELVALTDFKEDPNWIAKRITPNISPLEAKQALDELIKLGLIGRDSTGRLSQVDVAVTTTDEVTSSSIAKFHREMMKKGAESIDRIPREKREISSVTVGVSEETAKRVKEMIQVFRKEILEVISQDSAPTEVYQLNFQLFPLTEKVGDSK